MKRAQTRRSSSARSRRSRSMPHAVLLGSQSDSPILDDVLRDLAAQGRVPADARIAAITAGWRDREGEPGIVDPRVAARVADLGLYRRAERIAEQDPALAAAHKTLQKHLKALRRAYNVRLAGLIDVQIRLGELRGDPEVLDAERADVLEAIRELDSRQIDRVTELRASFEDSFRPLEREAVKAQREEIRQALDGAEAVVLAGGHIASLLNRLRLFGIVDLVEGRVLIAWGAGAMALAPRVVLFHDRPPWGAGHAEAFDRGLGVVEGIVPFPQASVRLALDDRARTGRLASRFAPDACVLLDPRTRLDRVDGEWVGREGVRRLDRAGRRRRFGTAAA